MKNDFTTKHLDVKAFARSAGDVTAEDTVGKYERLMEETQGLGAQKPLKWSARGEFRTDLAGAEQIWLHLTVDAVLPLTCQRCLAPTDVAVRLNQSYRFVESEAVAQAQDAEAEEDVLALSPAFSLTDLIEDEVLMALPPIPMHDLCPVAVKLELVDPGFEQASNAKRQPFAVLAQLKSGRPD